jgi:hypothetical protein
MFSCLIAYISTRKHVLLWTHSFVEKVIFLLRLHTLVGIDHARHVKIRKKRKVHVHPSDDITTIHNHTTHKTPRNTVPVEKDRKISLQQNQRRQGTYKALIRDISSGTKEMFLCTQWRIYRGPGGSSP